MYTTAAVKAALVKRSVASIPLVPLRYSSWVVIDSRPVRSAPVVQQHVRVHGGLRLPPWAAGATSTAPFHFKMPEIFVTSIALTGAVVVLRVVITTSDGYHI
ncbi:hypothetical protein EVAR_46210_1 [Eumeta japonica]|uniref:Uncharacterized protein n=1 Tax=Eumeta variegata TaxID=151549 RepID=A0A4C1WFB4_EUMVA|nr:hypothetical protein EVAR_46210_1 [Eumeta japonica]